MSTTASISSQPEGLILNSKQALHFITWNLDGLDEEDLTIRTEVVKEILEAAKPDIVFLQEVIAETYDYLERNLPHYKFISGRPGLSSYFTATMINSLTVNYDSHQIIQFPGTGMGRNLLEVLAHIGQTQFKLLNTHLESQGAHAEERMNQLNQSFEELTKTNEFINVIFAGDLNLRDKELVQIGGIPPQTADCWESMGSKEECRYTWDLTKNTNKEMPGRSQPRCRFDRVYLRPAQTNGITAKSFNFIGTQKVTNWRKKRYCDCFPSDHWGLSVVFDLKTA